MDDYLSKRQPSSRRKTLSSQSSQQKFRHAILEAAGEISHEFSEHFWKDVLQNGEESGQDKSANDTMSAEAIKKGFLFYLNASGRYLVLREHLRSAISNVLQQRCITIRPSGFQNHSDFQTYLHDMYVFLVDEMHDIMSSITLQETDPLKSNLDRLLQQTICDPNSDDVSKPALHQRQIDDLGIFAEEAFAQGDLETAHKLHLQRICKDNESSRSWTDFAVMWLSKGDNRMAEVSVNEALRKDPYNIAALLISGILFIRNGNERGLDCLNAALGLRPMSPELLVIVGLANNLLGNDQTADFYFRKAAYVHRAVTGEATTELDKLFSNVNMLQLDNILKLTESIDVMDKSTAQEKEAAYQVAPLDVSADAETPQKNQPPRRKSKRRNTEKKKSQPIALVQDVPTSSIGDDTGRQSMNYRKDEGDGSGGSGNQPPELLLTSSTSLETSGESQETELPPKNPFLEMLKDISYFDEVELPTLTKSIQTPWDPTEFNERLEQHLKSVDFLSSNAKVILPPISADLNKYIPTEDGVVPDSEIKEEYDKILSGKSSGTATFKSSETSRTSFDSRKSGSRRASSVESGSRKRKSKSRGASISVDIPASEHILPPSMDNTIDTPSAQKMTNRLGSELIWAANLLVNLRLFDFLDGVLAKHLSMYKNRTLQYIYLRALSLYLRQRENEALTLVKEAVELDPQNGPCWALQGHCNYAMGNVEQAINCYETALKIPSKTENRHLLYLRYGSLTLNSDNQSKLAKRAFLHGVSKYPTPYMWLALGSTCFERKEYDQAESSFSEANRLDNTNPVVWGHLALSSLMQNKKSLAEQSFKWAIRFGLKDGHLMDEIQKLQKEKGFGDPSFPRIPNCIPHDYFLRRIGTEKPFDVNKEYLNQEPPKLGKGRYDNTDKEEMLIKKFTQNGAIPCDVEWEGEEPLEMTCRGASDMLHCDQENNDLFFGTQENQAVPPSSPHHASEHQDPRKRKGKRKEKKSTAQ